MLPFALTIFTGAFLLFQVQPLIGKYILPWFGGGPGVWTTCMLFFQALLLGGYAYAHLLTTRLPPRRQVIVHLGLLLLAVLLLPITPSETWKPDSGGDPVAQILLLLAVTLGVPYFVLSSTGPLLQHWFSLTRPGVSPYRLYALSNIGSLLALMSYPFYFEWAFTRQQQAALWSVGLGVFVLVCAYCALQVRKVTVRAQGEGAGAIGEGGDGEPVAAPTLSDKAMWVLLPAIASVLLLATTNKLSQDVAVIPFLWVLPLGLYLLTFILCFDHSRWYRRNLFAGLLVVGIGVVCHLLFEDNGAPLGLQVVGYVFTLFVACMMCHGELYRLKPAVSHLTAYYLYIAAGGALGGLLVGVVAPLVLNQYLELQVGLWALTYLMGYICLREENRQLPLSAAIGVLALAAIMPALQVNVFNLDWSDAWADLLDAYREFYAEHWKEGLLVVALMGICFYDRRSGFLRAWQPRVGGFVMFLALALAVTFFVELRQAGRFVLEGTRNFYGMLKVVEYNADDPTTHYDILLHGGTTHGLQFRDPLLSILPTTYYGETSGVGRAIRNLTGPVQPRKYGLVGLGTGSLATYGEAGDSMRIYEINPEVERLARSRFRYLDLSPADIQVVLGDARLSLEEELRAGQSHQFDLLALDAFSSDAIPVHLLTRESMELYLAHMKPDGVIAVHISNRYLDLEPVVENLARHFGLGFAIINDSDPENWWVYRTTWVLLSRNQAFLDQPAIADLASAPLSRENAVGLWTDERASLFKVLR